MRGNIVETLQKVVLKKEGQLKRMADSMTVVKQEIATLNEVIDSEKKKQLEKKR